jgi:hypothetical protein
VEADAKDKALAREAFLSKYHRLKEAGIRGNIPGSIPIVDLSVQQALPEPKRPRMYFWRLKSQPPE